MAKRTQFPWFNDSVVYTFGSNKCRKENETLDMTGNAQNQSGYAVSKPGKITALTATWDSDLCGGYAEELVIQVNGQDTNGVLDILSGGEDVTHVCIYNLDIDLKPCDTVNIVSRQINKDLCWNQACNVAATITIENFCEMPPVEDETGIFEAYLSDVGVVAIPTVWSIVDYDQTRVNTIPMYVAWNGTEATLEAGTYRVDYNVGITTQTSTSLNLEAKLVVDGADYPASHSSAYILSGNGGSEALAKSVTLVVDGVSVVRVEAKTDVDSSTNASADANIIIQRISD